MRQITTQIGSLPYKDVSAALDHSLRHDIPFLPELPSNGDAMLDYIQNPGRLSCLGEFKQRLHASPRQAVKVQCIGPATLVLGGYGEDDAIYRASEHIRSILTDLDAGEIYLFLDEPALGQVGFDYEEMWGALFEEAKRVHAGLIPGVHTCGNMDWDRLYLSPNIQVISHDASLYDVTPYPQYATGRRKGKTIAWGIQKPSDIKDFRRGDLITLPCGMNPKSYKPEDCEPKLRMLNETASLYENL